MNGAPQRRLRIVSPRYGPSVVGGAEDVARNLAQRLASAGWDVDAWTTCAVDAATWHNHERPGLDEDGDVHVRRFRVVFPRQPMLFAQFSRAVLRCPSLLRPESLWMTLQGPYAPALIRALAGARPVPTLFLPYLYHPTVRGLRVCKGPRLLMPAAHDEPPLRFRAVARVLGATDGILFATPEERMLLEAAHPSSAVVPATVGSVGVDTPTDVDARRFRDQFDIRGPYLLYGGRAVAGKGMEMLIDAARQLGEQRPDCQLVLTGDARTDSATAGRLRLRVTGRLERSQLWDALAGATAVVVPSQLESLSLLALEAWAVGRPALLNGRSPSLAGQAQRSRGALLFTVARELADAAVSLIDNPGLADSLGHAGREYVQRVYAWPAMLTRFTTLVDAAAAYHRGRTVAGS